MFGGRSDDEDGDGEWRFSVEEVGDDGKEDDRREDEEEWGTARPSAGHGDGDDRNGEEAGEGNVAGTLAPDMSVEPGDPELENVAFVTAGALLTVLAFASLAVPLDAVDVALAIGVTAAVAGLAYLVFRRY